MPKRARMSLMSLNKLKEAGISQKKVVRVEISLNKLK